MKTLLVLASLVALGAAAVVHQQQQHQVPNQNQNPGQQQQQQQHIPANPSHPGLIQPGQGSAQALPVQIPVQQQQPQFLGHGQFPGGVVTGSGQRAGRWYYYPYYGYYWG